MFLAYKNLQTKTNSVGTAAIIKTIDKDMMPIVNLYKKTGAALQVVKWYKETYHVGLKEAKDRVDFVLDKHGLRSLSKSGSGCMITILIAISSTLSAFFLL